MIPKPIVTGEHGAWAILFVPILTSYAEFGRASSEFFLITVSICFTFFAFKPTEIFIIEKRKKSGGSIKTKNALVWSFIYSSLALLPALILFFNYQRFQLIAFAVFGLFGFLLSIIFLLALGKSLIPDLIGIAWISSSTIIIYSILYDNIDYTAVILWLINFLFFASSAFYVHMKMRMMKVSSSSLSAHVIMNFVFHFLLIAILIYLWLNDDIDSLVAMSFAPMIIHAILGSFRKLKIKSFKPIGFTLLGYSVLFMLSFFLK